MKLKFNSPVEVNKIPSMTQQIPTEEFHHIQSDPNVDNSETINNSNLFFYNQVQTLKEKELMESRRRIQELQESLEDCEANSQLHLEQINRLKEEIRELERSVKRDNGNLEYLKNVVVKYMETNDHEVSYTCFMH